MTTTSVLPDIGIDLREGYADVGDQSLHYVEAGDGPLLVLLHGFPEFWFGWRKQIAPLAEAGFRVVAPDTRGYNLSSKPEGFEAYGVDLLAADIRDLIGGLGAGSAHLVGHDWGGSIAWTVAMAVPAPAPAAIKSPGKKVKSPGRNSSSSSNLNVISLEL